LETPILWQISANALRFININQDLNSIQLLLETPIIKDIEVLGLSLTTIKKEKNYNSPVLFQLYHLRVKDLKGINIEEWIDKAHVELGNIFESSITKQCKKGFDNV